MERPAVERMVLGAALVAAVAVPLVVSVVAIAAPAHHGPTLPLVTAGLVILVAVLAAASRFGPLARLAARLPASLDRTWARRRGRAILWAAATLLAFAQIVRLSAFMTDPGLRFGAAFPPVEEGTRHMCMAAYVQAADLARRSDPNLYAAQHYPAARGTGSLGHEAPMSSPIAHLGACLEDPYEYPPPFLVLPRLALLFTNDFFTVRTAWFGLQAAAFLIFAAWLAGSIGGRRGLVAGLLLPVLWLGMPLMFNFQFGQFHLACVTLAMGGMAAFQRERPRLGGALLGAAIVTKLFPGLLLVVLAAQRRWRAVLWTAAFCLGYAALGLVLFGPAPYRAFFQYHLPRVLSGEAFAFFLRSDLTVAANYGIYGIPFKLQRLGLPGMSAGLASLLNSAFTVVLLVCAIVAGRRPVPRELQPAVWLGLLILGSLRSPLAPNVYTAAPALWLLTLVAVERHGARAIAAFVAAWLALGSLPPLPDPKATIALWMVGQAVMLVLGFWVVLRRAPATAVAG